MLAASGIPFVPWVSQRDSVWDLSPCQGCTWETELALFHLEHDTGFFALMPCPKEWILPKALLASADLKIRSRYPPNLTALFLLDCELLHAHVLFLLMHRNRNEQEFIHEQEWISFIALQSSAYRTLTLKSQRNLPSWIIFLTFLQGCTSNNSSEGSRRYLKVKDSSKSTE